MSILIRGVSGSPCHDPFPGTFPGPRCEAVRSQPSGMDNRRSRRSTRDLGHRPDCKASACHLRRWRVGKDSSSPWPERWKSRRPICSGGRPRQREFGDVVNLRKLCWSPVGDPADVPGSAAGHLGGPGGRTDRARRRAADHAALTTVSPWRWPNPRCTPPPETASQGVAAADRSADLGDVHPAAPGADRRGAGHASGPYPQ